MTQKLILNDLTLDEINTVLIALQELSAKICNPLSDKIRRQATAQLESGEPKPRTINHSITEGVDTVDKLS